jgi:hypothetical protein
LAEAGASLPAFAGSSRDPPPFPPSPPPLPGGVTAAAAAPPAAPPTLRPPLPPPPSRSLASFAPADAGAAWAAAAADALAVIAAPGFVPLVVFSHSMNISVELAATEPTCTFALLPVAEIYSFILDKSHSEKLNGSSVILLQALEQRISISFRISLVDRL